MNTTQIKPDFKVVHSDLHPVHPLYGGTQVWEWEEFQVLEDRRGGINARTIYTLSMEGEELFQFDSSYDRSGFKNGVIKAIEDYQQNRPTPSASL